MDKFLIEIILVKWQRNLIIKRKTLIFLNVQCLKVEKLTFIWVVWTVVCFLTSIGRPTTELIYAEFPLTVKVAVISTMLNV